MVGIAMTVAPTVHHWRAGDDVNAMRMNEIKASIDYIRNPPFAHVRRRTTTQTLTGSAWTKITFDQLVNSYDPYGMWDAGTPDRLTIDIAGWYIVQGVISFQGTATNTNTALGISKNGFATSDRLLRFDQQNTPSQNGVNIRKETLMFLNSGDFVHLGIFLGDAASRVTQNLTDTESPQLKVRWASN